MNEQIDEILEQEFIGLWTQDENGDFVSVSDTLDVLKNSLKQSLLQLIKEEKIKELEKMMDTFVDDDSFTYSRPVEDGWDYDVDKYVQDRIKELKESK